MGKPDDAVATFKAGFNCAQAVLAALGPDLGLTREQCLKAACAFGGGMARTARTCGAVTGAMMAIGLKHGQTRLDDPEARKNAYKLTRELMQQFVARNKSLECRDLLGCDIGTEAGLKQAMDMNFHKTVCPKFVKDASEIAEKLLAAS